MSKVTVRKVDVTHSSDSSPTLSKVTQAREDITNSVNAIRDLLDIAAELLTKSERRCILDDSIR